MNIQALVAIGIGLIQGVFLIPFALALPQLIVERVVRWKKGSHLPLWEYIITLAGILFFIIVFFSVGWIWIDLLSNNEPDSSYEVLVKFWGQSMFLGVLVFFLLAIAEEEFRKRMSRK